MCLENHKKKKKPLPTQNIILTKLSFKNEDEIKFFPDKQKLREFIPSRPAFQEVLKEVLQVEMKIC